MKKNTFYASALMFAALTACTNETEEAIIAEQQNAPVEITLRASLGGDTRTYVNHDASEHKTYWAANDQIYVWGYELDNENKEIESFPPYAYGTLSLGEATGSETGTFKGFIWGGGAKSDLKYALYPVPDQISSDHKTFYFTLKHEYYYEQVMDQTEPSTVLHESDFTDQGQAIGNAPMCVIAADNQNLGSGTDIKFSHLCGMVRLELNPTTLSSLYINTENTDTPIEVKVYASTAIAGTAQVTLGDNEGGAKEFGLKMNNTVESLYSCVSFKNIPANKFNNSGSEAVALDIPVPVMDEGITYTVRMTYPFKMTDSSNTEVTGTNNEKLLYQGKKKIGKGQMWIPEIGEVELQFGTDNLTDVNTAG